MVLPKPAWGRIMTSPAACESGAGEQIVDLVVLRYMERMVCLVLDDHTMEWLLKTCLEI